MDYGKWSYLFEKETQGYGQRTRTWERSLLTRHLITRPPHKSPGEQPSKFRIMVNSKEINNSGESQIHGRQRVDQLRRNQGANEEKFGIY